MRRLAKVHVLYTSDKISKVRCLKLQPEISKEFLTAGWFRRQNTVRLWKLIKSPCLHEYDADYTPFELSTMPIDGFITGLEMMDNETAMLSTGKGQVMMLKITTDYIEKVLKINEKSECLHRMSIGGPVACTGIAIHKGDVVSIGEDGRMNIISTNSLEAINSKDFGDIALTYVRFLSRHKVIFGNQLGVVKLWDIRSNEDPSSFFTQSDNKSFSSVTSLVPYPNHDYVFLVGGENGSITVWDIRQPRFPSSCLAAHAGPVSEMIFHPAKPELFSASESGDVWQWKQKSLNVRQMINLHGIEEDMSNPWLCGALLERKVGLSAILAGIGKSVNTLDMSDTTLFCGADNNAIYSITNLL